MRSAISFLAIALLAGCAAKVPVQPVRAADMSVDWTKAETVSVTLSDFDFTPGTLTFRTGQPVRLMLTNTGSGRHDFAAPAFFNAAAFRTGGTVPAKGKVALDKNQTAEIDLVPGTPGQYPLDCTELLHDMLGMTGQITVTTQ